MLRMAVLTSALAGCAYQPGSFSYAGPKPAPDGERVTVGCLDLAISRRLDYDASAVIEYWFGNRCNRTIEVDLQRVAVVGRFGDGREVELSPYDPQGELRTRRLSGRLTGREAIAYRTPRGSAAQVCVDAASIVRADPARWVCFGSPFEAAATADDVAARPTDPPADSAELDGTDQPAVAPEAP